MRAPTLPSTVARHRPAARIAAGLILVALLAPAAAWAAFSYDPRLHWRTFATEHFRVHYHQGEELLARQAAVIAERVHRRLTDYFDWEPLRPTDIVLTDRDDRANGSAIPFPRNVITIVTAPPDDSVMWDHAGWLDTVITHEYTHILHLDLARGTPDTLRDVFGRFPLLFPNAFEPTWLIEGLATYVETDADRGIGRGQDSWFAMLMRLEVAGGIKPLAQVNQPLVSWPGGTTRYLYGVQFLNFVAARYGPQRVRDWVEAYSWQILPYRLNGVAEQVFGKDMTAVWAEFSADLEARYRPQIEKLTATERAGDRLTRSRYSDQPQPLPNGDLVFVDRSPAAPERVMLFPAGAVQPTPLIEVHQARIDLHPTAGLLVAQVDSVHNLNAVYDLYHVSLRTRRIKRLTRGGRYPFAAWSPDGGRIAAVHTENGRHALHLLDRNGGFVSALWSGVDGEALSGVRWSPDGRSLVAAVFRPLSGWDLEVYTLDLGLWRQLTRSVTVEGQPYFSPDGLSVLFTADTGGVFNIRRIDLATGAVVTLTNVVGGAFQPVTSLDGGTLYYTGYIPGGHDLFRLNLTAAPPLPTPAATRGASGVALEPPDPAALDALTPAVYSPWPLLRPAWWFPTFLAADKRLEFGFITAARDALERHTYSLEAGYDVRNRWWVGALDYTYDRFDPTLRLHADRFTEATLDANNDLERIRESRTLAAELIYPFLSYWRQLTLHAGAVLEHEQDLRREHGAVTLPERDDRLLGLGAVFNSARRYPQSISPNAGRSIAFTAEDSAALHGDFTGQVYTLDWHEFRALGGEHVLAVRAAAGWGTLAPNPFRLGGARLDRSLDPDISGQPAILFNQRRFGLRGYPSGLPDLRGRRMLLASAEWRFPLALIERGLMVPPLGLHQLHGALFYDTADAWDRGGRPDRMHPSAGAELRANLVFGYWIPFNLRAGWAHGFGRAGEDQFYLRLGLPL